MRMLYSSRMAKDPLKEDFQYYIDNQADLLSKYEGKFIVIKDKEVVGAYDSEIEAYEESQKQYELGTFLIQKVSSGPESYTQTFYSQVAF